MTIKTKILIGVLVVIIVGVGGWWIWRSQIYPETQKVTIITDQIAYGREEKVGLTVLNNLNMDIIISACPTGEGFVRIEKKDKLGSWKEMPISVFHNAICAGPLTLRSGESHTYSELMNTREIRRHELPLFNETTGKWIIFDRETGEWIETEKEPTIEELGDIGTYRIKFGYLFSLPYSQENTHWAYSNEFMIKEKAKTSSIEMDLKSCSVDSDCIKISANPCTSELKICRAIAINKRYKDYWNNLLTECKNKGVGCEDTAPSDESFRMDPECIKGVCELTKQRPYTVAPQCGVATTDHLISFGWFPVDESKHVIQIDNNPDFTSPEIEEYETSSGVFRPKTPLEDGTYYWRVKSTKLEREKCLPPPCVPNVDEPNEPCNLAIKGYLKCKEQYSKWSDVCNFSLIRRD